MRIEDVRTPTLPLADACEILRCEGYRMSVDKLKAGIFGGVYPFGEVIDRVEKTHEKRTKNAREEGYVRVRCLDFSEEVNLRGRVGFPNTEKGREKNKLAKVIRE